MVRRGTAAATQTTIGGPPPALSGAPDLLCTPKALARRLSRAPLSNHPNEPLAIRRCQIGRGVSPGGGAWLGEAAVWGDPLFDPSHGCAGTRFSVRTSSGFSQRKVGWLLRATRTDLLWAIVPEAQTRHRAGR